MDDSAQAAALAECIAKYSNWGRWGADDEIGTANHITGTAIREAARGVTSGRTVGLSLPLDAAGPQNEASGRSNCVRLSTATGTDHLAGRQLWNGSPLPLGFGFADDTIVLPLHSGTHWDSLSHIFHEGRMYNGRSAAEVSSLGAEHNGVEALRGQLVGRGVLLDLAASQGVESLPDGHVVDADQLDAAAEFGRVSIRPGDILLLRTGQLARCRAVGWGAYAGGDAPGLGFSTVPWLAGHEVAAVASDTWGVEVRPSDLKGAFQPLHLAVVVYLGLLLGEIFDLEELAVACAEERRYEFFVSAPPLAVTGGSGGPTGPIAVL